MSKLSSWSSLISLLSVVPLLTHCREESPTPQGVDQPAALVTAGLAPVRFGELAKTPYFEVRALNWKPCAVEAHLSPRAGLRKVAVEIELRAVGTLDVPSNPFYALLTDRDGKQFESTLAGCPPILPAARLATGETARGWVTFDIPETTVPHALVYQPAVIGVAPPRAELLLNP